MSPVPIPRPCKRARAEADELDITPCPPPPSIRPLKCERSPPPLSVEKRLVTSGSKRFTPVPNDCLPPCTDYKQNRSKWIERCVKELEALNLIPERKLFRDDGLVIDWRSHVLVWSDTLKPDPQDLAAIIMLTHRSNAQWHRPLVRKESPLQTVTTISSQECPTLSPLISGDVPSPEPPSKKKRLPAPPRPSSKRRSSPSQLIPVDATPCGLGSSFPCTERPRLSYETESESHSLPRDCISNLSDCIPLLSDTSSGHDQAGLPPRPASRACDQSFVSDTPSAAEEDMSEMTLNYLRRYVQTYESERASLASAYASDASFAYRVHHIVQSISEKSPFVWADSPNCFSSGNRWTRLDIATTLLTLPSLHVNAQSPGAAQIEYDMFYLGAKLGMFVVCRVVDSTKTVAHNFILQRKEVDVESVWPLTATAHQILVFET